MEAAFDEYLRRPCKLDVFDKDNRPDPRGRSGTFEDLVRYAHRLRSGANLPVEMILLIEGDRSMSEAEMQAFHEAPNFSKRILQ